MNLENYPKIDDILPENVWVMDIESDALKATTVWVVVARNMKNEIHVFHPYKESNSLKEFMKSVKIIVGHNWINFDGPVLDKLYGIKSPKVIDTLVISRLLNYNQQGGHSLAAWGERLGFPKIEFDDFSSHSPEMDTYCKEDTLVTKKLVEKFWDHLTSPDWYDSLYLEHNIANLCQGMHTQGFSFDNTRALQLINHYSSLLESLDLELHKAFPPKYYAIREVTPRVTKKGTLHRQDFRWWKDDDLSSFSPGCPFTIVDTKVFNPASPKDIVTRLNILGWKPTDKTKGHIEILKERNPDPERLNNFKTFGWRVSEENLATLPKDAPSAAQKLVQRVTIASRLSDLEEWSALYNEDTGRIHGTFLHIGSWTGRMAHRRPNMANIPGAIPVHDNMDEIELLKAEMNYELRSLWGVPERGLLVGCDADGIQLRMFAHYCEDSEFIESLLTGDKAKGTDPHSVNQRAIGELCKTRAQAKTFIYSFLMGAGPAKLGEVLGTDKAGGLEAQNRFFERYPKYAEIRGPYSDEVWRKGYFEGLDGRKVIPPSKHKLMSGLLQNGESVVMKRANLIWQKRLQEESVPFWQVNFVHDEWQTETVRDRRVATYIGECQADAIRQAGVELQLKCPMAGNFEIGRNWYDTH